MPPSRGLRTNSSGLSDDPCPQCGLTFLTKPILCQGFHNPRNKGRWYQECEYKEYDDEPCCSYFRWRPDIPRLSEGGGHPGYMDDNQHTPPSPSLTSPLFSDPSSFTPFPITPQSTPTSTPSRPRAARQPCANPKCTERGHPTGHRNLQCRSGYCKTCCQKTTMSCPAPRHNEPITAALNSITVTPRKDRTQAAAPTPSAATSVFSFERPMAKSIDPSYALNILQGGHDVNYADRVQHDQYRKQNLSSIQIKWWAQNGAEPQVFTVNAPAYPFFHPKDSQPIVRLTSPVRVQTQSAVFMRSPDVTDCPGAPRPKRRLSDSDQPSTPTPTRQKSFNLNDNTTYNTTSQLTPTKPNSIISISSTDSDDDSARSIATQIVLQSPEKAAIAESVFPREFAQDMDGGFRAMDALTGTVPHRFNEVFQNRFVHGTFYSHFNTWKVMTESDEGKLLLQKAVDSGTDAEGSWTRLLKRFGKTSAK
ncbi:hypothetical protein R3P38DRAFT_3577798 [Favolaschia claudopus]|uniref:Uncharacterized protein n=1 Tax=Favolaschia claudopus TaxID=2862362 RepID=A0AAW0DQT0_9AGAR